MEHRTDLPWPWKHVTQNTLIRTGQGALHSIILNQSDDKGMVVVWDGLETLATIIVDFEQPRYLLFDLEYKTDLFIGVAGTWDLTVTYI